MKRVIKFRALKDDMSNCNWMIGQLVYDVDGIPRITAPIDMSDTGRVFTFHSCIKGTEGQFTGLLDKNGKEIYEGDIVKCFHEGDHVGNYDLIEFENGAFTFRYRFTPVCTWLDFDGDLEVLGNIYENPDLLK